MRTKQCILSEKTDLNQITLQGKQDAAIVAATMMYEAEEIGVHNVWLRGFDSKVVAETFDLPENCVPVMMFAMGYPAEETKPSDWHFMRKPIEETVTVL